MAAIGTSFRMRTPFTNTIKAFIMQHAPVEASVPEGIVNCVAPFALHLSHLIKFQSHLWRRLLAQECAARFRIIVGWRRSSGVSFALARHCDGVHFR